MENISNSREKSENDESKIELGYLESEPFEPGLEIHPGSGSGLEINPIRMDGLMALIYPSIRKIQISPSGIRMAIRVTPKLLV